MHDPALKAAIKEAYAEATSDDVIMHTLELRHASFKDDNGTPVAIRVVNDYADFVATLEADAPLNAGETVTFTAFAFEFQLPKVDDGGLPELAITMDNVGRVLTEQLEKAALSTTPVSATYRPYLASDPSGPQMDPPLTLEIIKVKVDPFRVTASASFKLLHNIRFPRVQYTLQEFPSLQ